MKLFWCFLAFLSVVLMALLNLCVWLNHLAAWDKGGRAPCPLNRNLGQLSCFCFSLCLSSVPIVLEPHGLAQPLCCYTGTMADWLTADICTWCEQYLLNVASNQQHSIPLRRISWAGTKLEWFYHIFLLSLLVYLKKMEQLYAPTAIKAWMKDLPAG